MEPELLAGALAVLLRDRGWEVVDACRGAGAPGEVDVLVVSTAGLEADIAAVRAPMTLLLPDAAGRGGSLRRADGSVEVLQDGELESLLEILASGC